MKVFTQKLLGQNVRVMNYDSDNEFYGAEARIEWGLKIEEENSLTTVVSIKTHIKSVVLNLKESSDDTSYKEYEITLDDSWTIESSFFPDYTVSINHINVYMNEKLLEVRFN